MTFANCRLEKCLSCSHLLATLSLLLHHANIICDHSNALNTMSPYSHAHLHCLLCMSLTCCACRCICTAPCPDVSKFVKQWWGSTSIAVLPYYCRTTLLLLYYPACFSDAQDCQAVVHSSKGLLGLLLHSAVQLAVMHSLKLLRLQICIHSCWHQNFAGEQLPDQGQSMPQNEEPSQELPHQNQHAVQADMHTAWGTVLVNIMPHVNCEHS